MSDQAPQVTNSGVSDNHARVTSLADAIASNLTAAREEAAKPPVPEQPKPQEQAAQPEPKPEPPEPESKAEQETEPEATPTPDEAPERYTLADFADAAELEPDALLERFEIEVPGEDGPQPATLKDVVNGYRWNAANTQRAQELAEERRQVQAKLDEISDTQTRLNALLGVQFNETEQAEQALEHQYRGVNWAELEARRDGSYADQQARFNRAREEIRQRKEKLAQAWTQAQQQAQELAQRQQAEALPKAQKELLRRIPEWSDSDRAMKEGEEITRFVSERYGISPEEQGRIRDPGIVHAMRELWQLKQRADAVPLAEKKVKTAPKVLKPGRRAERQDARTETKRKLANRLKRTGHRNDLAALIMETRR